MCVVVTLPLWHEPNLIQTRNSLISDSLWAPLTYIAFIIWCLTDEGHQPLFPLITLQLILHKLKTNMDAVQHERLNQTIFEQVDLQQEKILVLNVELDTIKTMQLILQLELLNVEMKVDVGWTKYYVRQINFELFPIK